MNKKNLVSGILFFCFPYLYGQVINYVSDGGFEECVNCSTPPYIPLPKYWSSLDSNSFSYMYCSPKPPVSNLPYFGNGYQNPKLGDYIIASAVYCQTNNCTYTQSRGYPRNRLKEKLKANIVYCVKYFVVNRNTNTVATDAFGAYFGDESLDTIKYCSLPLTYLNPQIENQPGNIISDTLNWTSITGTFTANGSEKYVVLGNFKGNNVTNTIILNPADLPYIYTDVFYDDVSVIELNLPAFAGRDTAITPGDSVFIGRQSDIGIDEACMWYKLPTVITPTTPSIDTSAGFWIKPVTSCTYVVRQEICGLVKWDTVRVDMNPVGIDKLKILTNDLKIYPNPARDFIELKITTGEWFKEFGSLKIINNLGQIIRKEELIFKGNKAKMDVSGLMNGVCFITISNEKNETITKKLLIEK